MTSSLNTSSSGDGDIPFPHLTPSTSRSRHSEPLPLTSSGYATGQVCPSVSPSKVPSPWGIRAPNLISGSVGEPESTTKTTS